MDEDVAYIEEMTAEFMLELPPLGFDTIDFYRSMFEAPPPGTPTGFEEWTEQVERIESSLNDVRSIVHVPNEKRHEDDKNCGIMFFHGGGGVMSGPDDI